MNVPTDSQLVKIVLTGGGSTLKRPAVLSSEIPPSSTSVGDILPSWNIGEMRPRVSSAPLSKRRPVSAAAGDASALRVHQPLLQHKQQQPINHVLRKVSVSSLQSCHVLECAVYPWQRACLQTGIVLLAGGVIIALHVPRVPRNMPSVTCCCENYCYSGVFATQPMANVIKKDLSRQRRRHTGI